jgi:hypothetical protein
MSLWSLPWRPGSFHGAVYASPPARDLPPRRAASPGSRVGSLRRRAKATVRTDGLHEGMIDEFSDLPAGGADGQGSGCFEDDLRGVEDLLEDGPKLAKGLPATVRRQRTFDSYRPGAAALVLSEGDAPAGKDRVDQDLPALSILPSKPVREIRIVDLLQRSSNSALSRAKSIARRTSSRPNPYWWP